MSDKGHVVIAGHRFPVKDVRLTGGAVEVTFVIRGPLAPCTGHVTVFGEDGQGIMQGHQATISGLEEDETWTVRHSLRFTNIESYDTATTY